jgi:hypothetical protein
VRMPNRTSSMGTGRCAEQSIRARTTRLFCAPPSAHWACSVWHPHTSDPHK